MHDLAPNLIDIARAIATPLDCAKRCACGGWQRVLWCPESALLAVYCGACGGQMEPDIHVWADGNTSTGKGVRPQ